MDDDRDHVSVHVEGGMIHINADERHNGDYARCTLSLNAAKELHQSLTAAIEEMGRDDTEL